MHTVIDDHSRLACPEICTDEKAETAAGVLERAVAWFAHRGIIHKRNAALPGWLHFYSHHRPTPPSEATRRSPG